MAFMDSSPRACPGCIVVKWLVSHMLAVGCGKMGETFNPSHYHTSRINLTWRYFGVHGLSSGLAWCVLRVKIGRLFTEVWVRGKAFSPLEPFAPAVNWLNPFPCVHLWTSGNAVYVVIVVCC